MLLELGNPLVASFPRFSFPGFWFSVFLPRNRQASIQAVLSTRDDPIPGQAREPDFVALVMMPRVFVSGQITLPTKFQQRKGRCLHPRLSNAEDFSEP